MGLRLRAIKITKNVKKSINFFPPTPQVLVGNKTDKGDEEREIPSEVGEEFSSSNGLHHFLETSAKEADNVDRLFGDIARELLQVSERAVGVATKQKF